MIKPANPRIIVHFKQWSRKHYAVLKSLSSIIKICSLNTIYTIIITGFFPVSAQADSSYISIPSYAIEEIEVMGQKNPAVFPEVARMVTVIRQEEIASAPVQSLQDLLDFFASVDICQRGQNGVQADMTMRGGSFDHVMVLLNGIVISDPQTGHFNLDIPVDIEAIQRIEILNGPAARIYGPGAFTGAINIVIKPGHENFCKASFVTGNYDYRRLGITTSVETGSISNLLNMGHSGSSGYTENTDFSIEHIYYTGHYYRHANSLNLQAGYQQKAFGANGFYSPRYPGQYEKNNTSVIGLNIKTGTKIIIQSSAHWRRKQDHFMLQRDNPGFYQNFHCNNVFGSQLTGQLAVGKMASMAGFDLRSENIISSSLGLDNLHPVAIKHEDSLYYSRQYSRSTFSWFQEHVLNIGKLSVTAGYMINWNSDYSTKPAFFPGLDINYAFRKTIRTFVSFNRTLRFPTFTDMFYNDPSHQGNINLEPDRMISVEGGMHADFSAFNASIALHRSFGRNIIDWLWLYETDRYSPVNIERMTSSGIEIQARMSLQKALGKHSPVHDISIGYNYLDVNKSIPDTVSKYYNLKHKLTLSLRNKIIRNIYSTWYFCYQDRLGSYIRYNTAGNNYFTTPYKSFFLIDGNLAWEAKRFTLFMEVSNLLNTHYVEAGSLFQPGRWIKAGIKANMVFVKRTTPTLNP